MSRQQQQALERCTSIKELAAMASSTSRMNIRRCLWGVKIHRLRALLDSLFSREGWTLATLFMWKKTELKFYREGDKRQKHNPCLSGSLWRWHGLKRNTITTVTVTSAQLHFPPHCQGWADKERYFSMLRPRRQSGEFHPPLCNIMDKISLNELHVMREIMNVQIFHRSSDSSNTSSFTSVISER